MKLSAPTQAVWLVAVILGVVGIVAHFGVIPAVAPYAFWLVGVAFIILGVATLLKGL